MIAAARIENWPTRLDAVITAARAQPFDWRDHHCGLFVADCVEALTGVRIHAGIKKQYATRRAVTAARDMRKAASTHLDTSEIAPGVAQRGDVVLVSVFGFEAMGVCVGRQVACLGPAGMAFLGMEAAICAWRI
jgi:hypothetical protein